MITELLLTNLAILVGFWIFGNMYKVELFLATRGLSDIFGNKFLICTGIITLYLAVTTPVYLFMWIWS